MEGVGGSYPRIDFRDLLYGSVFHGHGDSGDVNVRGREFRVLDSDVKVIGISGVKKNFGDR